MGKRPIEVITPPNTLKAKVGGKLPKFDESAIARAENALKGLSGQFHEWLAEELEGLETAFATVRAQGLDGAPGATFYRHAHDLKGMGATYEFPIITRLADSLCKLLDDEDKRASAPLALVAAHVQAIKAAIRDKIRDDAHPLGKALAEELEGQVGAILAKRAA